MDEIYWHAPLRTQRWDGHGEENRHSIRRATMPSVEETANARLRELEERARLAENPVPVIPSRFAVRAASLRAGFHRWRHGTLPQRLTVWASLAVLATAAVFMLVWFFYAVLVVLACLLMLFVAIAVGTAYALKPVARERVLHNARHPF